MEGATTLGNIMSHFPDVTSPCNKSQDDDSLEEEDTPMPCSFF